MSHGTLRRASSFGRLRCQIFSSLSASRLVDHSSSIHYVHQFLIPSSQHSDIFMSSVDFSFGYLSSNFARFAHFTTPNFDKAASIQEQITGQSRHTGSSGKPFRRGPVSWLSFLLLLMTGAGLVYYFDKEKKRHIEVLRTASLKPKEGPSVGKAAIGGPFRLVNHHGKPVTEQDFMGKWSLIYFGFTHCPDICPDELQKLAAAVDKIKEKAGLEIVPVFISVDPERDTVDQVRQYVQEFHPKLVGLTGDSDAIRQAARAYRVYYMKTVEEDSDYLVDHSIVMYLMDPMMEFVRFFGKNCDADELAESVIREVKQYKS